MADRRSQLGRSLTLVIMTSAVEVTQAGRRPATLTPKAAGRQRIDAVSPRIHPRRAAELWEYGSTLTPLGKEICSS